MQTEPNLRVLKLCKQLCFKTSILLEPRASVPVLSFACLRWSIRQNIVWNLVRVSKLIIVLKVLFAHVFC
ncbi:hypothetical protein HMPREF9554_02542 [Treponema phagedenis F0421]|nr:hypothetical protein HMPREF9554_02542 [Treponema phagedenis F0421]